MDFPASIWWWLATGALVAAELASGTFYLLMCGIGTAAGAIAAAFGFSFAAQLLAAALVGGGAVAAWHGRRSGRGRAKPAAENRDVNLDIGQRVQVASWGLDCSTRVAYRGATWSARYVGAGIPLPGEHVIHAIDGSELQLDRPAS